MLHRKYFFLTLVLIYIYLVTNIFAINSRDDLNTAKVKNFINSLQHRNTLYSTFNRESKGNIASPCFRDLYEFIISILKKETWAMKMLDAASKIPSGLFIGNIHDFGMYDECLSIHEVKNGLEIQGRHCMYSLGLSLQPQFADQNASQKTNQYTQPRLSVCFPSSCNATDVTHVLKFLIFNMTDISKIGIHSLESTCSDISPPPWTSGSIAALTVIVIIVAFLLSCTFLDLLQMRKKTENKLLIILSKFSLKRSASKILNTRGNQSMIPVMNGIRTLSICWILMGHAYALRFWVIVNKLDVFELYRSWKSLYVTLATFAVDSFFSLSGFLMAYVFLKEMSKGRKFNLLRYYLHRYIRLTPAILMMIIITIFIIPQIGSGPNWQAFQDYNDCNESWWIVLLYLQNFIQKDMKCLPHLWYLAVDMQLFWFSPIILYPLSKKPKIGLAILAATFIASTISVASIVAINKYQFDMMLAALTGDMATFKNLYIVPYTRAGPWLVGIFVGYITVSREVKISKMTAIFGWTLAIVGFVYCTLGVGIIQNKGYKFSVVWESIFESTSRSVWGMSLMWIIFASNRGYGGPVAKLLSWPIFNPLSKLSYCIYLVHIVFQSFVIFSGRVNGYFSNFQMISTTLSDLVFSTVIAFFFSLFFESPFLILEKILLRN